MKWIFSSIIAIIILQSADCKDKCSIDPLFESRIRQDLLPFQSGITSTMVKQAAAYSRTCLVTIAQHRVHAACLPPQLKCFYSSIAHQLPDLQFVVNELDQPRVLKHQCRNNEDWRKCTCDKDFILPEHGFFFNTRFWEPIFEQLPIFSSGTVSACFLDILMPSLLHISALKIAQDIPWENKTFKAIWRGSSTGGFYEPDQPHFSTFHRSRLVGLCLNITDCDARFSNYFQCVPKFCIQMRKAYGSPNKIALDKQFINKIIIDIDGNTYSGRFPILLLSGSAVFKAAAFEDIGTVATRAWRDYVPLRMNASDLQSKLNWARKNDKELQLIAIRGKTRALETMNIHSYQCYMILLLRRYKDLWIS